MSVALPIHTSAPGHPDEVNAGSAFLCSWRGDTYLFTAAHVPIERPPTADWRVWPRELNIHLLGVGFIPYPLFRRASPAFGHHVTAAGTVVDAMWMSVAELGVIGSHLVATYPVLPVGLRRGVRGEAIRAYGFPIADPWPQATAQVREGVLSDTTEDLLHTAEIATGKGFSGGPVVRGDETLGGMIVGRVSELDGPATLLSNLAIAQVLLTGRR